MFDTTLGIQEFQNGIHNDDQKAHLPDCIGKKYKLTLLNMIIIKKRIREIGNNFPTLKSGDRFLIGIKNIERFKDKLNKIGFEDIQTGLAVLPSPIGQISLFNAEGKYLKDKTKPKETAYREAEWHWKEWHGRDQTIERSKTVYVPYKRYPRVFISPPSLELKILKNQQDEYILVTPVFELNSKNEKEIIHGVNLILEIFGECQIFSEDLDDLLKTPTKRLNWKILPEGKMPWQKLKQELKNVFDIAGKGKRIVIGNRIETVNKYNPEFAAVGTAGFTGYIILGFPKRNLYVLESAFYGNATYVFEKEWEKLSRMTKAEILTESFQKDRLVHQKGWETKVKTLLG